MVNGASPVVTELEGFKYESKTTHLTVKEVTGRAILTNVVEL